MFPELALKDWRDTNETLHLFLQIVGKIRLELHPKQNHWWHVPFYVSVSGLTTGPIPYDDGLLEMEFNFIDHALHIKTSKGDATTIHLAQHSVADFYNRVIGALHDYKIDVTIRPQPYDVPYVKVDYFEDAHQYATCEKVYVETMWQILISVNNVFQEFRGRFLGKSTPVHLFWHHFDLALTRFSGRKAPEREGVSQVEAEAYSHEVISFGFWFGDDNVPAPAFYAYGFPPPDNDVYSETLQPEAAKWNVEGGMAVLNYDDIRTADDPRQAILDFLESVYQAYAKHMDWDVKEFQV